MKKEFPICIEYHDMMGTKFSHEEEVQTGSLYDLFPGLNETRQHMTSCVHFDELIKYKKFQEQLILELDKLKPYFDYKKDKKIKLDLDPKDLFMVILNPNILSKKNGLHIKFYDAIIKPIYKNDNKFMPIEYLRMLDLSSIKLDDLNIEGMDLSYTNINVDPQKVDSKSVKNVNFEGMDLKDKNFNDVFVLGAKFKDCQNLNIDPQKVKYKNISYVDFENIDLRGKCFDDTLVIFTNFKGTNADINPQKVKYSSLCGTNCYKLNFENKCFDDVIVEGAILDYTNANINPQKLSRNFISNPVTRIYKVSDFNQDWCYVSLIEPYNSKDLFYMYVKDLVTRPYQTPVQYYETENYYELAKIPESYTSLKNTSLRGLNFKDKNFDNVDLEGVVIDDKNAKIDPQKTCHVIETVNGDVIVRSIKNATLEDLNLSNKSFKNVIVDNATLINTNANFDKDEVLQDFELRAIIDHDSQEFKQIPESVKRQVLRNAITMRFEVFKLYKKTSNGVIVEDEKIEDNELSSIPNEEYVELLKSIEANISLVKQDFSNGKFDCVDDNKKIENYSVKELYKQLKI